MRTSFLFSYIQLTLLIFPFPLIRNNFGDSVIIYEILFNIFYEILFSTIFKYLSFGVSPSQLLLFQISLTNIFMPSYLMTNEPVSNRATWVKHFKMTKNYEKIVTEFFISFSYKTIFCFFYFEFRK